MLRGPGPETTAGDTVKPMHKPECMSPPYGRRSETKGAGPGLGSARADVPGCEGELVAHKLDNLVDRLVLLHVEACNDVLKLVPIIYHSAKIPLEGQKSK